MLLAPGHTMVFKVLLLLLILFLEGMLGQTVVRQGGVLYTYNQQGNLVPANQQGNVVYTNSIPWWAWGRYFGRPYYNLGLVNNNRLDRRLFFSNFGTGRAVVVSGDGRPLLNGGTILNYDDGLPIIIPTPSPISSTPMVTTTVSSTTMSSTTTGSTSSTSTTTTTTTTPAPFFYVFRSYRIIPFDYPTY